MNRSLFLMLIFIIFFGSLVNGQQKQDTPKDKKKIELKPNSREYKPVLRDNQHRRFELKRDKAILIKRRAELQRLKMMQLQKRRAIKQEQINKRRQIIQQRRALRK